MCILEKRHRPEAAGDSHHGVKVLVEETLGKKCTSTGVFQFSAGEVH